MSKVIKHKNVIVIGRISDDENIYGSYSDMSVAKAEQSFRRQLKKESDYTPKEWDEYGKEIYIDGIITSDSKMNVDWSL